MYKVFLLSRFIASFLRLFLPIALLLVSVTYLYGQAEIERELTHLKTQETLSVGLSARTVGQTVKAIKDDVLFLASLAEFRNAEATPTEKDLAQLTGHFVDVSLIKQTFNQIRWINEAGIEIIRVDLVDGRPIVVPADKLQYKGDRYYFKDSVTLRPGEVFVSPLDLNIEQDKLEQPYRPMLRVATPVVDNKGNRRGIVIINYSAQLTLDAFVAAGKAADHLILLNNESYFLRSPKRTDEWGFMFNRPELKLSARSPAAWNLIAGADNGQTELSDGIWTWRTVHPLLAGTGAVCEWSDPQSLK
ncbi:MAG: hypothetical protein PSV24_05775 [Rhodoferax sp.]|nr:hypothetical protein [Rhodoferax sp.]